MLPAFLRRPLFLAALVSMSAIAAHGQTVQFTRLTQNVEGTGQTVSSKEAARYERFLAAVFPTKPMMRFARTSDRPIVRRVAYSVVEQRREKFIIAAFTGRWKAAYNVLGIYKISDGPRQMWRSSPWEATYYDLHVTTAEVGPRTLVLFREGGEDQNFGLGSVFSFKNTRDGIWLEDLTPASSLVRVRTRFPFRPILAQNFQFKLAEDAKPYLLLSASDREYFLAGTVPVRPSTSWRFDRGHNRFEPIKSAKSWNRGVTTLRSDDR